MSDVTQTFNQITNPYREAYIWLESEHLDMLGMADALRGRNSVILAQQKLEASRNADQKEL